MVAIFLGYDNNFLSWLFLKNVVIVIGYQKRLKLVCDFPLWNKDWHEIQTFQGLGPDNVIQISGKKMSKTCKILSSMIISPSQVYNIDVTTPKI